MRLTVYSRNYCHLCHDMIEALQPYKARLDFELEVIDVDEDSEFEKLYGERVPVLLINGEEICHYHLDTAKLDALVSKIR